jgi:hypothetical protein
VQVGVKVVHRQITSNKLSQNWSPCLGLERSHHFHFYSIFYDWHWKLYWNEIKFWDFRTIVSKILDSTKLWVLQLCTFIIPPKKLQLKSFQGCSFWIIFSNVVSHVPIRCHLIYVSRILVVKIQILKLIPHHFFDHNLNSRYSNEKYEFTLDI